MENDDKNNPLKSSYMVKNQICVSIGIVQGKRRHTILLYCDITQA